MGNEGELVGGLIGTSLTFFGATVAITEIQAIISMVATIIGLIITIISVIVIPLVKKYRAAKKDGKITTEEVDDMIDTLEDGLDKVKDKLDK